MGSELIVPAYQGEQFGSKFFITNLTCKELQGFLRVFPDVQRSADSRHVNEIAKYLIDNIENGSIGILPPMIVNSRSEVTYDEETKQLHIPLGSEFSVNDGQHRFYAIDHALKYFKGKVEALKKKQGKKFHGKELDYSASIAEAEEQLKELEEMSVCVMILDRLPEQEERQIFTDINKSQKKVNRSKAYSYDTRDVYARIAHVVAEEWERPFWMEDIEDDKDKLTDADTDTFMLYNTLVQMVKIFAKGKKVQKPEVQEEVVNRMVILLNNLVKDVSQDVMFRDRNILGYSIVQKAIAKVAAQWADDPSIDYEVTVKRLAGLDWSQEAWRDPRLPWDETKNRLILTGSGRAKDIAEILLEKVKPVKVKKSKQPIRVESDFSEATFEVESSSVVPQQEADEAREAEKVPAGE